MKSIMQEGSSILKALEKAWESAGKPKEFSVKVFEEPQKNFLGMTTKPAKIGLFFAEGERIREERPRVTDQIKKTTVAEQRKPLPKKEKGEEKAQQVRVMWTEEMIGAAQEWLSNSLKNMDKPAITFSTHVNNYYLRFVFDQPILDSIEKERELFRSFSFLMLQALKKKFKRPLRGFKVVLTR